MSSSTPELHPEGGPVALPFLRIYSSGTFLRNLRLEPGSYIGGRDRHCELVLEGRFVSRKHFQIVYAGENKLAIQDLGSSNGTFVNGQKITRAPLGHGDEIQLGEVKIVVSHRTYAQSNVIPFPVSRTDPFIQVSEPVAPKVELPPPPAIPVEPPPRAIPREPSHRAIPVEREVAEPFRWGRTLLMVSIAGGIAYGLKMFVEIQPPISIPSRAPRAEETPAPSAPVAAPSAEPPPIVAIKKAPVKPKVFEPRVLEPTPRPKNELAESLNSLDDLSASADLGKATAQLKNSDSSKGASNLLALKAMKNPPSQSMDVEIKMPKMEEMTAAMKAMKADEKAKRPWTMEEYDRYQKMLRSRLMGVEGCYAKHGDGSGGRVAISLTLNSAGKVRSTAMESSTFKNKPLEECMVKQVSSVQMDPPPFDGFSVTYGFRFGARRIQFQ